RPQDRIELPELKRRFHELLVSPTTATAPQAVAQANDLTCARPLISRPPGEIGYGKSESEIGRRYRVRTGVDGAPPEQTLKGGGLLEPESMPRVVAPLTSPQNTNPETEIEMMQNRPTPDRVEELPGELPRAIVDLGH